MHLYLVDGNYELFRHYYELPLEKDSEGREVGAVRGVVRSMLMTIDQGAWYVAVATDHAAKSFRNDLWPGYKPAGNVPPALLAQFPLLEEALVDAGIVVWPMRECEATDALASAAVTAALDAAVQQVIICSPNKVLAQCVYGTRIVLLNRWEGVIADEADIVHSYGISPASIPDYLALVGNPESGYNGIPGWRRTSAATVLAKFVHLESIPPDFRDWGVGVADAPALADALSAGRDRALLFRRLATLRTDLVLFDTLDELLWKGPTPAYSALRGSPRRTAYRRRSTNG